MVLMASDMQSVELTSLDDFAARVGSRRDRILSQMDVLRHVDRPELGDFVDGRQMTDRVDSLRQQYVSRLGRLVDAMDAAELAAQKIAEIFDTAQAGSVATVLSVDALMDGIVPTNQCDPHGGSGAAQQSDPARQSDPTPGESAQSGTAGQGGQNHG
jgi:hypothetical protein